jgi:hypothetical protein
MEAFGLGVPIPVLLRHCGRYFQFLGQRDPWHAIRRTLTSLQDYVLTNDLPYEEIIAPRPVAMRPSRTKRPPSTSADTNVSICSCAVIHADR